MKYLTSLLVALAVIATGVQAATQADPAYEKITPKIVEGSWPTNGVMSLAGVRNMVRIPKQLCVDVGLANVTNTCTVTLYSAAGKTYTYDTLAAQVNGSESPIELTNKTYNIGYGETMKFTSSATGTDATNMYYRLYYYEVPQSR